MLLRLVLEGGRRLLEQPFYRQILPVEGQLAGFGAGQRAQVFDHALQAFDFRVDGLQALRGGGQHAVAHRFDVPGDHRQRRAQVVGDVGGHLAAHLVGARQLAAHLVEGLAQLANFIPRTHRHLLLQVAAGHLLRGLFELAQRAGERARQQRAHRQGDEDGGCRGQCHRAVGLAQVGQFLSGEARLFWRGQDVADHLAIHLDRIRLDQGFIGDQHAQHVLGPVGQHHAAVLVDQHERNAPVHGKILIGWIVLKEVKGLVHPREAAPDVVEAAVFFVVVGNIALVNRQLLPGDQVAQARRAGEPDDHAHQRGRGDRNERKRQDELGCQVPLHVGLRNR